MLKLGPVVLDIEGFGHKKSGFIIKELSVCTHNYSDTVSFRPPSSFSILSSSEQKSYQWVSRSTSEQKSYQSTPIAICSKLFKASNLPVFPGFPLAGFYEKGN